MALTLAESGYDIALHYHTSKKEAEALATLLRTSGAAVELLQADLADAATLPGLVANAFAAFPQLRHLVNSASIFEQGDFPQAEDELFDRHMNINLRAPVLLTRYFAKALKAEGSVVNLLDSKITAYKHSFFYYLISKKALAEFTLMAAAELGPKLRVNGVCPGYVLPSVSHGEEYGEKLAATLPLKKHASPADVAQAVKLLIANPALTGQLLFVDGGERLG